MKSSTEVLRRLLDELGVEYEGGERSLRWRDRNGVMMQAFPLADGELGMDVWSCTPEQAIAATLGSCNCSDNCTNSERTDVPRLPHFWTHDGALHVEATRMPTRIVVCEGGTCEFVPKQELDASEAENAKLRELVRDYEHCTMHADCSRCEYDGKISTHCPLSPCFPGIDELGELGVEVE